MSETGPRHPPRRTHTHQPARMLRACAYATMSGMLGNRVWFTMGSPLELWKPMPPGPELYAGRRSWAYVEHMCSPAPMHNASAPRVRCRCCGGRRPLHTDSVHPRLPVHPRDSLAQLPAVVQASPAVA